MVPDAEATHEPLEVIVDRRLTDPQEVRDPRFRAPDARVGVDAQDFDLSWSRLSDCPVGLWVVLAVLPHVGGPPGLLIRRDMSWHWSSPATSAHR
jgi:hypothetical protein